MTSMYLPGTNICPPFPLSSNKVCPNTPFSNCNWTFQNGKATVNGSNLTRAPQILTHLEHQALSLSKVIKFFGSKVQWLIFSHYKFHSKYDLYFLSNVIINLVINIQKWMWLPCNTLPALTILFVPTSNHSFVNAWDPTQDIILQVMFVKSLIIWQTS